MKVSNMNAQLRLNQKQWERFQDFVRKCNPRDPYEEDCAGTSPFTWVFITSGIGTMVKVFYGDVLHSTKFVDLTLGDDGEFLEVL